LSASNWIGKLPICGLCSTAERLDFFNNSLGYEGWQASVPVGDKELTVTALGGGRLTTH
jgi:hypothetical protein